MFKHRHLTVMRRENLTESDQANLARMLEYLPELSILRQFAGRIYWLFEKRQGSPSGKLSRCCVRDPAFQAVPELVKAMDQLDEEKFCE